MKQKTISAIQELVEKCKITGNNVTGWIEFDKIRCETEAYVEELRKMAADGRIVRKVYVFPRKTTAPLITFGHLAAYSLKK